MQSHFHLPQHTFRSIFTFLLILAAVVALATALPASPAHSQTLSDDADLSALAVSPKNINGFAADRTSYEVGVAHDITQATVSATANDSNATVAITPADADTATGHQVDLSAGKNAVTVTVTAEDGSTTKAYTVNINRGVSTDYGWKASDDLDGLKAAGNKHPYGLWSNGTTFWVSDTTDNKIYAYNADGTRDSSKDFNTLSAAGNNSPHGIWSDGTTMWVVDNDQDKIYAYRMSDRERDPSKDFNSLHAGNRDPAGIWSDGETMWVAQSLSAADIYAYRMSDKQHDSSKDFQLTPNNWIPGLWSDGVTLWVAEALDVEGKLYAYQSAGKSRDSNRDFNTLSPAGNEDPYGIWSDGETMWVVGRHTEKVYSYNMPPKAADTTLSSLRIRPFDFIGFDTSRTAYQTGYPHNSAQVTVTAVPNDENATVAYSPDDVNEHYAGHQVSLSPGRNVVTATVTGHNGTDTTDYTVSVNQGVDTLFGWKAVDDLDGFHIGGSTTPKGIAIITGRHWVTDHGETTAVAYNRRGKHLPYYDITLAAANADPARMWASQTVLYVLDTTDKHVYAYNTQSKKRRTSLEIATSDLDSANTSPTGIWSDGTTIWLADSSADRLFAYALEDATRQTHRDIVLDAMNADPAGIASNGVTMWVADTADDHIYAYSLALGTRHSANDLSTLTGAGNDDLEDISILGTTLYVIDNADAKAYTYNLPAETPPPEAAPGTPTGLTARARGAQRLLLEWTAPVDTGGSGITQYLIERSPDGSTDWQQIGASATESYTDDTLTAETTRHYRVAAVSGPHTGPVSLSVSAATTPKTRVGFTQTEETQLEEGGRITVCIEAFVGDERTPEDERIGNERIDGYGVPFRIIVTTVDGTANANEDYQSFGQGKTLWFDSDDSIYCFQVDLIDDRRLEDSPETFRLELSTEDTDEITINPGRLTVNIYEDDHAQFEIIAPETIYEGTLAQFTVKLTTQGDEPVLAHAVGFRYQTTTRSEQTASSEDDYTPVSGRLIFPPGVNAQTINVPIAFDTVNDPDETFSVLVTSPDRRFYYIDQNGDRIGGNVNRTLTIEATITDTPLLPGLEATNGDDARTTVSWDRNTAPAANRYQYRLRPETESDWTTNWRDAPRSAVTNGRFTITALQNRVMYHIQVRGFRNNSPVSLGGVSATPIEPPGVPAAPVIDSVGGWNRQITAEWTPPAAQDPRVPITSYDVRYRRYATSDSWRNVNRSDTNTTTRQLITGVDNYQPYEVQVAAVNRIGRGPWASYSGLSQPDQSPPTAGGDPDINLGVLAVQWASTDSPYSLHEDTTSRDTIQNDCLSRESFRVYWDVLDRDPEEYETHFITHGGAGPVTHEYHTEYVTAASERPSQSEVRAQKYIHGRSTLHRDSRITVRVRVRFDPEGWSTWSQPTALFCREGQPASTIATLETSQQQQAETENMQANGQPTIRGTVEPGQTVTTSKSEVSDQNGLTKARFTYQWFRDDGTGDVAIPDETSPTYTVKESDTNTQLSVQIVFADDDGFQEKLTSPEVLVQQSSPLYGGFDAGTVPASHDGSDSFQFEIHFSEEPDLSYVNVRDHVLTVTGGDVTSASRTEVDGSKSNIRWTITLQPDGNDDVTVTLGPTTGDCTEQSAVCTASGKKLSNQDSITVAGPEPNQAATGKPTISGTAEVGQTLTADTSAIADGNGLTGASFAHQWLRSGANINGATSSTYTVVDADGGETLSVRVSFTDDAGHEENLTSNGVDIPRPPLTASFSQVPASHDGSTTFEIRLHFSDNPQLSYINVRDHVLTITNGDVDRVQRVDAEGPTPNKDWKIWIDPGGNQEVVISITPTTDCNAPSAVCTSDNRMLSNSVSDTVDGP